MCPTINPPPARAFIPPESFTMKRIPALAAMLFLLLTGSAFAAKPESLAKKLTFERDIRPILKAHCFQCHGEEKELEGMLDVRLRRLIVKGGESGPALVAGKPEESELYVRISDGDMPPGDKKVPLEQLAILKRWILEGAITARPEPKSIGAGTFITEEERSFWSFHPVRRSGIPNVKHSESVRNPIDAFLLEQLEAKGFTFTPRADQQTLIRRATFDLLGLPPTPEEAQQFLADKSPGAYERLIERLLKSPHYGERWGRHWLDVAGYADSEGYTNADTIRSDTWKYRDYVIRAMNADMPFDRFVQEQLAGDEMVKYPYKNLTADEVEKLTATGFLRMSPDGTAAGEVDQKIARNDVIANTIQITSTALLGLTVNCAQCHDHRYDPIPQADYYRLRAVFEPAYDWKSWRTPAARRISLYTDADREKSKQIEAEAKKVDAVRLKKQAEYINATYEKELAKIPAEMRDAVRAAHDAPAAKRTPDQKKLLKDYPAVNVTSGSLYLYDRKAADDLKKQAAKAAKIRATKPKEEYIRALTEVAGKVPSTFLFHRGDPDSPKDVLEPAGLTVLASADTPRLPLNDPKLQTTGRRLAYARLLTSGKHPQVARVLVNRAWMHHFGKGIVETPGDFGALGLRPSHPELLDWLADEFVKSGWSLKRLHRLLMTSNAYQQGVRQDPKLLMDDPDNKLLGGMTSRRLEAEALRDAILAVSGKLNTKRFGPAVPVMADIVGQFVIGKENLNAGRPGAVVAMRGEEFRRSVYVQVRRSRPLAVLDTFDFPRMDPSCEARTASTVATQSLMLLNNGFVVKQSEYLAARVRKEAGDDLNTLAARAWSLVFSREPTKDEITESAAFLTEQTAYFESKQPKNKKAKAPEPKQQALASLCQTLMSSNAFLYVD